MPWARPLTGLGAQEDSRAHLGPHQWATKTSGRHPLTSAAARMEAAEGSPPASFVTVTRFTMQPGGIAAAMGTYRVQAASGIDWP